MQPTADDVRAVARSAPARWESLHLLHRVQGDEIEARLRHGELDARRLSDGWTIRERGAAASSWTVRPLEPIYSSYTWAAMLDPYELSEHVTISEVRSEDLYGRPTWRFRARAQRGYDPICACCPLVFSEVSQRLEYGEGWVPPAGTTMPDGCDLAIDVETGIVVSSRDAGGSRGAWFENEILAVS